MCCKQTVACGLDSINHKAFQKRHMVKLLKIRSCDAERCCTYHQEEADKGTHKRICPLMGVPESSVNDTVGRMCTVQCAYVWTNFGNAF